MNVAILQPFPFMSEIFLDVWQRIALVFLSRKISDSTAGPCKQQCNVSLWIFIICNPISALPYVTIKLLQSLFQSGPKRAFVHIMKNSI